MHVFHSKDNKTMKTIMASKSPHARSISFSRRYFSCRKKPNHDHHDDDDHDYNDEELLTSFESSSHSLFSNGCEDDVVNNNNEIIIRPCGVSVTSIIVPRRKLSVSNLRSLFSPKGRSYKNDGTTLGSKVVGTLFGHRRGHVHIAFQDDSKSNPPFLIEISTHTSVLVREMASGLVRVALECDKKVEKKGVKLIEEPLWRAYCNGKKCGYAMKRDCGPDEWQILRCIGPITMGAGVIPGPTSEGRVGSDGEMMYMRAKFERIVGSKDSEAFYMMNPDKGNGGPELSVYLLRV